MVSVRDTILQLDAVLWINFLNYSKAKISLEKRGRNPLTPINTAGSLEIEYKIEEINNSMALVFFKYLFFSTCW